MSPPHRPALPRSRWRWSLKIVKSFSVALLRVVAKSSELSEQVVVIPGRRFVHIPQRGFDSIRLHRVIGPRGSAKREE